MEQKDFKRSKFGIKIKFQFLQNYSIFFNQVYDIENFYQIVTLLLMA